MVCPSRAVTIRMSSSRLETVMMVYSSRAVTMQMSRFGAKLLGWFTTPGQSQCRCHALERNFYDSLPLQGSRNAGGGCFMLNLLISLRSGIWLPSPGLRHQELQRRFLSVLK